MKTNRSAASVLLIVALFCAGCAPGTPAANVTPSQTSDAQAPPVGNPGPMPVMPPGGPGPLDPNLTPDKVPPLHIPYPPATGFAGSMWQPLPPPLPALNTSAPTTLNVVVSSPGSGTVTPSTGTYKQGDWVTLVPKPADGFKFAKWYINGGYYSSVNPVLEIQLGVPMTITAVFIPANTMVAPPP